MNRWKRESRTGIVEIKAHNRWSNIGLAKLEAARRLGLNVGEIWYREGDGSRTAQWYVSSSALDRVGGELELFRLACKIADRWTKI